MHRAFAAHDLAAVEGEFNGAGACAHLSRTTPDVGVETLFDWSVGTRENLSE